jgi:hypothetical protein
MDRLSRKSEKNFELSLQKNLELNSTSSVNVVLDTNILGRKTELVSSDIMRKVKKLFAMAAICAITSSAANAQVEVINNGNVGIGTLTPTQKLHVVGNSFFNGNMGIGFSSPTHKLHVVGNSFFNGNVGIGTTSPNLKLDVNGSGIFRDRLIVYNELFMQSFTQNPPFLYADMNLGYYDEHWCLPCPPIIRHPAIYSTRSNNGGGLYLGTPDYWADHTFSYYIDCQSLYHSSDMRSKENIRLCTPVLSKLKNIKSYNYDFNDEYFKDFDTIQRQKAQKTEYGFLAQELQIIFPELVNTEDTIKLSINYIGMIPILTAAINELQEKMDTKIEELTLYIAELERRIAELGTKKGGN